MLQVYRSHAVKQIILKLSVEILFQSFTRSRKTVPGCHSLWSSCLSTKWMEIFYCDQHPGVELICYGARNLQFLLYVTHLKPSAPSYHWYCFSGGYFDLFHFLGVFYVCMCLFPLRLVGPWKLQIKCWREAPQMQAEGTAWLPRWGRREGLHCLTIKLSSAVSPYTPALLELCSAVFSCTVILWPWGIS